MVETPYYRNTGSRIGAFTVGELTRALDDASAFFDGPAPDSQKQQILEKMVQSAMKVVTPLRKQGWVFTIGRSYSEGASNHGQGNTFDLVPGTKDPSDCYALAQAVSGLGVCDQIWVEASDDEGNYHVHVKVSSGTNTNPDMKLITSPDGGSGSELVYLERTVKSLSSAIS